MGDSRETLRQRGDVMIANEIEKSLMVAVMHDTTHPPRVTRQQRLAYGILCAWMVFRDPTWRIWARRWLSGEDRTVEAARAERLALETVSREVWDARGWQPGWCAMWSALCAAKAATFAVWTDWVEAPEAWAAEWAATDADLDLVRLAKAATSREWG